VLDDDLESKLPNIDPSKLEVTKTITPKQLVPNEDLVFGRTFTGAFPPRTRTRFQSKKVNSVLTK
jgi:hypothetical protein